MKYPLVAGLSRRMLLLGIMAVASQPISLIAASYTWNKAAKVGTESYSWLDAQYWNTGTSGTPLAAGDVANINIDFTTDINITFGGSTAKAGILNVGDAVGTSNINFSPGGASQILTMQAVSGGTAAINKTSGNIVTFSRGVSFASDTVVTASGGELRFAGSPSVTMLRGAGKLIFEGSGGISRFTTAGGTFATTFTGATVVRNGGTLLIDNTFQANTTGAAATVTVADTGTLGGAGEVARLTTIQSGGTLARGLGKDVITFSAGLNFEEGAHFKFGLLSNASDGRGTTFNGVNSTGGGLTIAEGSNFDLIFNNVGSSVDFSNDFWNSDQEWLVFDSTSTLGSFSLGTVSVDSLGHSFSTTGGTLSLKQIGTDVYLSYSVIPEPSASLLMLGSVAGAFALRRKFRR